MSAPSSPRGLFLTFEGTEGSGKSTQMRLLVERLRSLQLRVVTNQEPGGTEIGKQIRRILLDPDNNDLASRAELLLMFASRAQAAAEVIGPALASGALVISDRFTDSTLAYQGEARGLGFDLVRQAHQVAVGSLMPDLTLCLDIDVAQGLTRAQERNAARSGPDESRIDRQSLAFHERVQQGYRKIASEEPARFRLIDGEGSMAVVAERVWAVVEAHLKLAARQ